MLTALSTFGKRVRERSCGRQPLKRLLLHLVLMGSQWPLLVKKELLRCGKRAIEIIKQHFSRRVTLDERAVRRFHPTAQSWRWAQRTQSYSGTWRRGRNYADCDTGR